ncbi:MAG: hypothetical protein AAF984_06200 [Verrucomicrobiota bacterium]
MKFRPYMIAPLLCLLVATSQFILCKTSPLSPWKGGGYGMYTQPPPISARTVWLKLSQHGKATFYRIQPLDSRIEKALAQLSDTERHILEEFSRYGRRMSIFPNQYYRKKLTSISLDVLPILRNHDVFAYLEKPQTQNLAVKVFEIRLKKENWIINEI